MNLKRTLIERLPPGAKRLLAVPYDFYQVRKADAQFAARELPDYEPDGDAPEHIVCVVVDALRADHIDDDLTPYLTSLNGGDAITPGAWTFPAVSSLLSGVYPHEHGAMKQTDEPDDSEGLTLPPRMDENRETITTALAGAGYDTYGGFGHDTPFVAVSGWFHEHALYHKVSSNDRDVLDGYLDWVSGRKQTFSFLHLAGPHIPVDPPQKYWDKHDIDPTIENLENWQFETTVDCKQQCQRYREHRRRLYRASVDYVDDELARFESRLDDLLDDYLLIVTADHGEALWEHVEFDVENFDGTGCIDHGGAPYEELARVPLLTNAEWDFDEVVSLVDLPETVADVVGIDEFRSSGQSLLGEISNDRMPIVEGSLNGFEKKAIYDGEYKLIVSKGDDVEIGYKLPDEEITEIPEDRQEAMRAKLPPWPGEEKVPDRLSESESETEVSDVVEDRLDQLGYR